MRVKLTRKLADYLDGIDVSAYSVGDVLDLSPTEARLLSAEGWAEHCEEPAPALGTEEATQS
jgi:hypothetical protein